MMKLAFLADDHLITNKNSFTKQHRSVNVGEIFRNVKKVRKVI